VIDGQTKRTAGSIILLDESRKPALRWNFREGWPSKWEGPGLNGKTSEVAIETMEIAHEGLELADQV
jgi:phage tail-like protein